MQLLVSNASVAPKIKATLLAIIIPAVAVVHAAGYDWGANDDTERYARDAAVIGVATAVIMLAFSLYAHFNRATVDEPVAVAGSLGLTLGALTSLFLAFDWGSEGLIIAVSTMIGAAAAVWGVSVTRDQVTPVTRLQEAPHIEPQDHFTGEH